MKNIDAVGRFWLAWLLVMGTLYSCTVRAEEVRTSVAEATVGVCIMAYLQEYDPVLERRGRESYTKLFNRLRARGYSYVDINEWFAKIRTWPDKYPDGLDALIRRCNVFMGYSDGN